MPHGPGSILVDTTGGWKPEQFVLYDDGKRPVLQLSNDKLGLVASYILDYEPQYNDTSEMCRNDVLGTIMERALAKATVKNKRSNARTLKSGQTLVIGSYLIAKNEGIALNQENVFGFIAHNHTCAEIHLSRTPFKSGEENLFDAALDSFTYDPDYIPAPADYALMAKLLPPAMAAAYGPAAEDSQSQPGPSRLAPPTLTFAFPNHPGYLRIDAPAFAITELSAKPNGNEFGIRAQDKTAGISMLGFLYLPPGKPPLTSASCMQNQLMSELSSIQDQSELRNVFGKRMVKNASGLDIGIIEYSPTKKKPNPFGFTARIFVAANDVCADISFDSPTPITSAILDPLLNALVFDPNRQPDFFAKFRFATVLYDHHQFAAAAPIFADAISLLSSVDDPSRWRRIAADQASMSYGMSGDLKRSRAISEAAIAKDPDYPLYYYNLACADAESGDATAARTHLQQAFDRRANTIQDEKLPDPTTDDSILKLKKDKAFWAFVQSLPKN